jgi:YebC/PmpR family DNA-binding regulatory protein
MSGHSKWSTIKRKKGAVDAKRGKIFSKLNKEIMVAARIGGSDPTGNPRLRAAITAARAENMPKDTIDRAIKKGTGELDGASNFEEIFYEGYGPAGVALLVESLTDNKNRTVSEVRHLLSKYGGSMGEAGCVAWMFDKKGVIAVNKDSVSEEDLMEVALEAGAEDLQTGESEYEVITDLANFEKVKTALEEKGYPLEVAEIQMHPKTTVRIEDEKPAQQLLKLLELLEDLDDVQNVFANFDIPDSLLEAMG